MGGVLAEFGAKWKSEWWWVYDPITDKFIQNELTHKLRNSQAAEFRIDHERHEIRMRELTEPWGCGSRGDRYRVENDHLIIVHKEDLATAGNDCTVTVSDLVGGIMRVTSIRGSSVEGV